MMTPKAEKELAEFQRAIRENLNKTERRMTPLEAVRSAYKKHPVMEVMRDELVDVLVAEAQRGGAADVEKKKLKAAMAKAWAEDGLTLSERTTHGRRWVVEQATKTIEAAIKKGGSVMTLAKELFDGYGHDHVIPKQEIPKFMGKLVALSKDYQGNAFKRALRDAQRNIDKLSTQGLKAAYNGIIDAISKGNEEMVDKAIYVATQEKARYFAERIARTEKARAYMDGVMYKYANDPDCIAFKWKLSSRHPCDDICDLYARADLWGMGEGIFPKDKLPKLPVHPNCMCRVVPIFHGSTRVTSETPKDKTLAGGLAYIMILTEMQRHSLLGVNGAKEVQKGASWKQYARGYSDEVMESRVQPYVVNICDIDTDIYSKITSEIRGTKVIITQKQIEHIKERHADAAEIVLKKYKAVLKDPDYIFLDEKHEHTGLIVKKLENTVKGELINIVLRIAIAEDKPGVKHSIITGWKISEARLQNYLRMKTNVYSKE
uniref:PBECR2 nuclease fold domain-containing protein n=1 Tax=Dialister sp. TaxID=1955814 RepID=UPI0040262ED6